MLVLLCSLCSSVCPTSFQADGSYVTPTRDPSTGKEIVSVIEKEFQGCTNIRRVVVSEGVTVIGSYAFASSSLNSVSLPNSLTEIRERAFTSTQLTTLTLPFNVSKLGMYVFASCPNLRTINLGKHVSGCPIGAFAYLPDDVSINFDSENPYWECVDGLVRSKSIPSTVAHVIDKHTNYVLPTDKQHRCASNAFAHMTKMVTFVGRGLINLHSYSFRYDSRLINITLGTECCSFDAVAFTNCDNFQNIFVDSGNPTVCDIDGIMYFKNGEYLNIEKFPPGKAAITTYNIPNTMNEINCAAFAGTNVATFSASSNHVSMRIDNGVVYSKNYDTLLAVPPKYASPLEILGTTKIIARNSINSQLTLTRLDIPEGVVEIGFGAFEFSSHIREINLPSTLERLSSMVFHGVTLPYLLIPGKVTELPNAMSHWSGLQKVEITAPVRIIQDACFESSKTLHTIIFPPTLEEIRYYSFFMCVALKSEPTLVFPESLKFIGARAFEECTGMTTNVTIPKYVQSIGDRAFYVSSHIECVIIVNCNTITGYQTFYAGVGRTIRYICIMSKTFTSLEEVRPVHIPVNMFMGAMMFLLL